MQKLITLCLLLAFIPSVFLQAQYSVTGNILDQNNDAIAYANTILLNAKDSSFVSGTTCDSTGFFSLKTDQPGNYLVQVSMIGMNDYYSSILSFEHDQTINRLGDIRLTAGGVDLEVIQVTADKPVFERQIDRMVVNVANTITSAGLSALEILERSPGVVVNRQSGTISMMGKDGVNVMINGRLNYMPLDALVDFLAGINADNILKIELITTPPANFDAQGNAGYINIVLKDNPEEGWNGNFSVAVGYGASPLANTNL